MTFHYTIAELQPYINWAYFYHAWQLHQPDEQKRLRLEAESFLREHVEHYRAHAVLLLADAHSDGDDIVLDSGERIPCLRQQQEGSDYLCLADFLSPLTSHHPSLTSHLSPLTSKIGLFATSADQGLETDFAEDPYLKMMAQLLADRLAEAAAERLHEQVRKSIWGYARHEQLSIEEMHQERFQGIRPAVGYPSLPDASINFILDELLHMQDIGITLTGSGAMRPHASVSGLMMGHPQAHYFSIGKIGDDQVRDYAGRRGLPVETVRKFLASNL